MHERLGVARRRSSGEDMLCLPLTDDDDKNHKHNGSWWRRWWYNCPNKNTRVSTSLPKHTSLLRRIISSSSRTQRLILLLIVSVVALLSLEVIGRLRFHGYLIRSSRATRNGQWGFYHEMDIDMQALSDTAKNPHTKLFPAGVGGNDRELRAWVAERRRRTNGRKFLVGCTADWKGYVLRSFLFMFEGLKSEHGWEDLVTDDPTDFFFKQDPKKAPSVLFFCLNSFRYPIYLFHDHSSYFQELRRLGTIIIVWNDDLHYYDQYNPLELRNQILYRTDVLVGTYTYMMDEYFASITMDMDPRDLPIMVWLPHSAGPDFTTASFNEYPINKILLSGKRGSNWYPLRHWLGEFQLTHPSVMDVYQHAGYYVSDNQSAIYASYLRSYRVGITTTLLFQYVIAKVFEIPATGALLVVNHDVGPLLSALGFVKGEHYISFDRTDPSPTIWWVAHPQNKEEIDTIRRRGMDLVREQHMVKNRLDALDLFATEGISTYNFPLGVQVGRPCPTIAIASEAECHARYERDALYKCDMWFCGTRSFFKGK